MNHLHPALAVLAALLSAHAVAGPAAPRPDIVYIVSDDQGWKDVGFHGSDIRTPNIDRRTAVATGPEVRRISHDRRTPLFLYLAFTAPHAPYQAPQVYLDQYAAIADPARRAYAAMITAMDAEIGNVVQALERRGMRDGKASLYEGGTRVVGLANWPGHIPAGSVVDQPVHIVDMYPTLVALAGVTPGAGKPLDGLDVWPTLPSKIELSDLDRDPGETTNVAADHPAQLAQLRHRIEALAREAVPPLLSTETLGVMRSVLFGTVKFPAEAAAVDLRP